MTFHIITLFPKAFESYLGESIIKRAIEDKKIKVCFYNPRDFVYPEHSRGAHHAIRIDKKPYGGGPGMVIQAMPVIKAIEKAHSHILKNVRMSSDKLTAKSSQLRVLLIWLTPSGKQFTNEYASETAKKYKNIIIICGRYEGIDARVKKVVNTTLIHEWKRMTRIEEISVGPFVLTGGELPAMMMIDSISRQIEGVLGNFDSVEEKRTASSDVYTRPEVLEYKKKKYRVPKILLSGHHKKIEEWKQKKDTRR